MPDGVDAPDVLGSVWSLYAGQIHLLEAQKMKLYINFHLGTGSGPVDILDLLLVVPVQSIEKSLHIINNIRRVISEQNCLEIIKWTDRIQF